jgi:hypothetical protein
MGGMATGKTRRPYAVFIGVSLFLSILFYFNSILARGQHLRLRHLAPSPSSLQYPRRPSAYRPGPYHPRRWRMRSRYWASRSDPDAIPYRGVIIPYRGW